MKYRSRSTFAKIFYEIKSIILVLLCALLFRIFILELFFVPTGSMKYTILENEYILSTKYSYGYSHCSLPYYTKLFQGRIFSKQPERGDIIVFRPSHTPNSRYIKRLIGIPGDKLRITNNVIYINDKPVIRKKIGKFIDKNGKQHIQYIETLPNGVKYSVYYDKTISPYNLRSSNMETLVIPNNQYFFLGDNRDNSMDSRFQLGLIPFENFIAKAQFVIFSTKDQLLNESNITDILKKIPKWICSIRTNRIFKNLYDL